MGTREIEIISPKFVLAVVISLDFCSVCYCWSYTVMSSFWCRQHRRESEAGDQTAPVQLGGGYQVPGKIWHKLYR